MRDTLTKLKRGNDSISRKILQIIILILLALVYYYMIFIWTPETYVSITTSGNVFKYIKLGAIIIFTIYTALQIKLNFIDADKFSEQQIDDYQMWNKFFLHFAFMKTSAASEKLQVLQVLNYLEDGHLKHNLKEIYKQNDDLKEAHKQIIQKYPYPQIKTFFAEAEDALVKGADGNKLMQKTALNVDKYITDILTYEKQKQSSYLMSITLLIAVVVLTLVAKLLFAEVFIDFTNSYTGLVTMIIFFTVIISLFGLCKRALNRPLLDFGGKDNE